MCKKNVIKVVTYTFALTMISAIPPGKIAKFPM